MFKAEIRCDCKCGSCYAKLTWGKDYRSQDWDFQRQWETLRKHGWTDRYREGHKCAYCSDYCAIAIEDPKSRKSLTWQQVFNAAALSQDLRLLELAAAGRKAIANRWEALRDGGIYEPPGVCCERHDYVKDLRDNPKRNYIYKAPLVIKK